MDDLDRTDEGRNEAFRGCMSGCGARVWVRGGVWVRGSRTRTPARIGAVWCSLRRGRHRNSDLAWVPDAEPWNPQNSELGLRIPDAETIIGWMWPHLLHDPCSFLLVALQVAVAVAVAVAAAATMYAGLPCPALPRWVCPFPVRLSAWLKTVEGSSPLPASSVASPVPRGRGEVCWRYRAGTSRLALPPASHHELLGSLLSLSLSRLSAACLLVPILGVHPCL